MIVRYDKSEVFNYCGVSGSGSSPLSLMTFEIPKIVPRNRPMASRVSEICSAGSPKPQILSIDTINTPIAGSIIAIIQRIDSYNFCGNILSLL